MVSICTHSMLFFKQFKKFQRLLLLMISINSQQQQQKRKIFLVNRCNIIISIFLFSTFVFSFFYIKQTILYSRIYNKQLYSTKNKHTRVVFVAFFFLIFLLINKSFLSLSLFIHFSVLFSCINYSMNKSRNYSDF
jgi:hypothetical protein